MTWLTPIQAKTYRKHSPSTRSSRPRLEPLEDRQLLSTCHVTRLSDSGAGKGFRGDLRYCINKVNAEPGPDAIDFTVTGTINLTGALPDLASDVDIQGPGSELLNVRRNTGGDYRIFTVTSGATVSMADLTVSNGRVFTNHFDLIYGGGILNNGTLVINRVVVTQNETWSFDWKAWGGGIHNTGDLTIIDSTISNNVVNGFGARGGGLSNFGTASIYSSTISENIAGIGSSNFGYGGGIYNDNGSLSVLNSTITENSTSALGPALVLFGASSFVLVSHSTIYHNPLDDCCFDSGGVYVYDGVPVFMRNSIVAGHSLGDIDGTITVSDHNLIGSTEGGSGFGPEGLLNVDPMLGPLADNGGPTLTRALLPGSPAIDAGDNTDAPEFDQRGPGFPRIVNGTIDIGAFEVQASPIPPTSHPRLDLLPVVLATADLDSLL